MSTYKVVFYIAIYQLKLLSANAKQTHLTPLSLCWWFPPLTYTNLSPNGQAKTKPTNKCFNFDKTTNPATPTYYFWVSPPTHWTYEQLHIIYITIHSVGNSKIHEFSLTFSAFSTSFLRLVFFFILFYFRRAFVILFIS